MKMQNAKLKIVLVILALALLIFAWKPGRKESTANLDAFAECLAEKGATMYGADWCPHCQNEKKAFGDSFRIVPYILCPAEPQKCLAVGINGYPTWLFPDGKKLEGEQGLLKLSQESGCPLPSGR